MIRLVISAIFLLFGQKPLSVIEGEQAFNSGQPIAHGSFLHTFDEPGEFHVISEGAQKGTSARINVIDTSKAVNISVFLTFYTIFVFML